MEIRALEIDFDRNVLKVNGKMVKDRPVIVTLPGIQQTFPFSKLFNTEKFKNKEECDRLEVINKQEVKHDG